MLEPLPQVSTTAECLPLKARHDKVGRRSRPQIPSRHNLRHTHEFVGEVAQRQSIEASVDQHRQLVVDPIRISKPVQFTEERCHVLGSTGRVDQPRRRVEHGPQSVHQPIRDAGECGISVVKARQNQWHDEQHKDWPRIRRTNAAESPQHRETAGHHLWDLSPHTDVTVKDIFRGLGQKQTFQLSRPRHADRAVESDADVEWMHTKALPSWLCWVEDD